MAEQLSKSFMRESPLRNVIKPGLRCDTFETLTPPRPITYLGTFKSCSKNFSAFPKRLLSPSKFFSISNSSNSGKIFSKPRNFSAPISSCSPSRIICVISSFVLRNCLTKMLTFKLRLPSSNVICDNWVKICKIKERAAPHNSPHYLSSFDDRPCRCPSPVRASANPA